jgi:tetratricopeptide (TPR) repeat protein/predicted PolB exonuclease-like 3'-5' exonuclease
LHVSDDFISVSDMPPTGNEKENYNCILEMMNVAVCEGLREIFKQEWDKNYGTTKGVWDDTRKSGNELYNMESARRHAKPYLNFYRSGKRSEWDCSALFDAILYSNAIKKHLSPHVSNKVDELRELRNELTHTFGSQHKISDVEFENAYKKVQNCFKVLKLSTADVEKIIKSYKAKFITCFPRMTYLCLTIFIVGLLSSYWLMTTKSDFRFQVLPTRPIHLVANRSQTVNSILEELHNLSIRNKRSLTYLYLSGNPGSGKSQLARLVGQRYGTNISGSWSDNPSFVMTLRAGSTHDILESYANFARRLDCTENDIANIVNSNRTTKVMKIQSLKVSIAKILINFKNKCTWLLIVDNVVKLSEISSFLPQLEDEDWQGGQVLITTQDMSSVPPNSFLTVHFSVSQGMDPEESCEFLTDLSGLVENHELVSKVAKELDHQPLALASAGFYVKQVRESKVYSQFTWKDYIKKLDEGKRELTEMKLTKANKPAYPLNMSTAVLLAVKMSAECDPVLKHAFTFLSYVSHEVQSLQVVVSYVLGVDKEKDKEDVGLRILQCSLILPSDEQKVVSILLHRVVHDSIKLYIANDTGENSKSGEPLRVLKILLSKKCVLGEGALIPHLSAFYVSTKSLSSGIIEVPGSLKIRQKMQTQIFDLTSALIKQGEYLLSKNYLILALKIATNQHYKDKIYPIETSNVSFPKTGEIYHNLGTVEAYLGNTKHAKIYLTEALEFFLRQHEPSLKMITSCLINLASLICTNPEDCNENLVYSKLALQMDDSLETKGRIYGILGNIHYNIEGDLRQATAHYLRAIQYFNERLHLPGADVCRISMNLALLWFNLGTVYYHFGEYYPGKIYLVISIKIYQKVTGPKDLRLAMSHHNLGLVHVQLNELPDAEHCFRRAIEIYSQHFEPSHEKIALVSRGLASVLEKTGRLDEATNLYKQYGTCRCSV